MIPSEVSHQGYVVWKSVSKVNPNSVAQPRRLRIGIGLKFECRAGGGLRVGQAGSGSGFGLGSDADVQLEWVRNPMVSLGTLF